MNRPSLPDTTRARKRLHRAWSMYDWANSAYNLVITSTIFPAYYAAITTQRDPQSGAILNDSVTFFGRTFKNSSLFDYSIAAAYLIIALLSPVLSSLADYKGNKKSYLRFFTYTGSLACCGLYFFAPKWSAHYLELGIILSGIAALGYCGGLVFYNAYLPEIASPEERDHLSAQGFARGYVGSVLLQVVCFVFVLKPEWFGWLGIQDAGDASRFSFLLVGLWWMLWAQIPFSKLPQGRPQSRRSTHSLLSNGFHELYKVWLQIRKMPLIRRYLMAFFCYSMGVQTVMLAATIFGAKELHLASSQLIVTILLIQLVAIAGAYLMARLSQRMGNLPVLLLTVFIWVGVCVAAYYTTTAFQFYGLAAVVGLIMGGIQSMSRSTYSKLMPATEDTTSFFSFFDVCEKLAIVLGMVSFGLVEELTGNMRNSILTLIGFFLLGAGLLLSAIRIQRRVAI
ncbi:MAG: MFS transporter [Bacteroidetes bacterium]|nr:MFS transporter [Bacteroidota bacterium]MBS1628987.1 MFS transporter [Bacteroidota bacterium]